VRFCISLSSGAPFAQNGVAVHTTSDQPDKADEAAAEGRRAPEKPKKRRRWWRALGVVLLALVVLLVAVRLAMPTFLRWYVNRTIDQSPLYDGQIGDIEVHLYRGAYTIDDIRLIKTSGNVPVPLFSAKRMDLAIEWGALLHGKVVGRVLMEKPELNFVDAGDEASSQTGVGGPWMDILNSLFPFDLNKAEIRDGSIHFRAYERKPPVDLYITDLQATVDNLKNIRDETTPLLATVTAEGLAMNHAKFQYEMKLDPFSYKPTFEMAMRLIGLDVTKLNDFARAYGGIDFEKGSFDLVVEVEAKEGLLEGYVKPLFRNLTVLSVPKDIKEDNPLELFWEAVVGVTTKLLSNPPRDQLATNIPLRGDMSAPQTNVFTVVMNVLRNAFIRAYLPKLQGTVAQDINPLQFGKGSVVEPNSIGKD
jgi:hypothetical protein